MSWSNRKFTSVTFQKLMVLSPRLRRAAVLGMAVASLSRLPSSRAATLFYDADATASNNNTSGAGIGGTGTWDNTTLNWWQSGQTTTDTAWGSGDVAELTGASGTMTLGANITAGGFVNYVNYTIAGSGSNTLTLSGTVNVGGGTTTISAPIAGSGFSYVGGALVLSGSNTFTGSMTFNGGQLTLDSATALGSSTFVVNSGNCVIDTNGQTLSNNNAQTWNTNFTFLGNGALNMGTGAVSLGTAAGTARTITVNNNTLTVGGTISNGTTATGLTLAGAGTLALTGNEAYTGVTVINGGTLSVAGALASTSLVLGGGTLSLAAAQPGASFSAGTSIAGPGSAIVANFTNGSTLALGAITRNIGSTVDFTLPGSGSITTTSPNTAGALLGGWATVSSTTWATSNGGVISGLTNYSSTFSSGADVDAPATTSTPGTLTINSLRFNNNGSYSINDSGSGDTLTITSGGILETPNVGGNSVTIAVANLTSGNGTDLIINQSNTNAPMTVDSSIGGSISLTKVGAGQLILNGSNTYTGTTYLGGSGSVTQNGNSNMNLSNAANTSFTGGLILNAGQATYTADVNLGATSSGVALNNAQINFAGTAAITDTHVFNFTGNGGTFNVVNPGSAGGKVTFSAAGLIAGSSTITKTGPGWLSLGGSNSASNNGNWNINAGVIETSTYGLGSTYVNATLNGDGSTNPSTAGELAINNTTLGNYIVLNGGILGGDNGTSTLSGTLNVQANSTIRLGDFYGSTNRSFNISGVIEGSGNLVMSNALNALPGGQLLTLSGSNGLYSGTLYVDGGHGVAFNNTGSFIQNIVTSDTTTALPMISVGFSSAPPAVTATGVTGAGVLSYGNNNGDVAAAIQINLATYGNGKWFLGGGGNGGSSFYSSIIPGVDSTTGLPVYRLGGSGTNSGLYIGNAVLTNYNNKTSSVVIGADLINGNGQIKYGKAMTYTGSTTVNSASQLVIPYVYAAASNNIPTATNLILAGGQLDLQENGTSANTQTLAGVTINPGGSSNINMSGGGTTANLLNLNGVTRNPGGAVDFTEVGTQSATNGITTTTANSTGGIIGGWATVNQNTWAVSAGTGSGSGLITGLGSFTAANASTGTPTGTTSNIDFQASTTWGTATINSLRFGTAVAGTLTLSGTLTDVSGGIIEASGVGNNATVITGGTLMGGAGTDLIVNQYNTANTLAINSVITDNGSATGLTKSGSGTLILGGSNTFTGQTYDNGGTLTLSNSLALQNSTLNFNILAGGISFGGLTSATLGGLNGNQYVTLSGTAGSVALSVGNNNANTNYSGVMMGAGSLTKIGTATLTMSGVNTYTGGTNVNAGTLRVTGSLPAAGTVNVNGGGTLGGTGFVFGPVIVAGGSSATAQGTVSLVDGAIDAFNLSGGLTVGGTAAGSPSTLAFDINASSSDTLAANNFNVNAGGARIVINSLVLGSALSSGTTYTLMTFNSSSGAGFATGSGTTVGAISLASSMLTFGVSGVLDVNSNSIQVVTSVSQAPSTAYWSGVNGNTWNATDSTGNYGNFTTDPAGTNFIQSYPSSNTNVIFSANGNGAPANLNNTLGANFDINSLTFLSNNPATTIGGSQTLTLESGGITVQSGAGAVTLGMASLVLDQSQTWTNSSATPLMVTSNVSGTGTLTTNGNIDMTGTNNFSGGAIVSSGTLQLGTGSLNTTGNLTVDGTLDMNGSNVTVATLSGSGTITSIAAGNATLTSNANSDSTFSGNITDGGTGETLTLVKNGTNTLTLSGTNSYSGGTVLNAGSIMVGNATALGKNAPLTINAGTLDLQAAGSSSGGNQNISVGSLSGIGGTITDNNSNSGVTTLIVNQTANAAYNGLITDGGSRQLAVTKTGASKLILTSTSNSYSGGTMISAGQLLSAAPGTVGSGTVTLSGGSLALGTLTSFGGNGVGWTVNQTGSYNNVPTPITNDVLTLTDNESNQGRFAFFQSPQTISDTAGFTASFTYTPSGDKIADGVSFVIENDPRGSNAIGGTGGALGYSGITNSGAVEFNIYSGATIGTAFGTASNPLPGNTSVSPVALGSGDPIDVTLMYSKDALTEKLTDPTAGTTSTTTFNNVDFNSLLGGNTGYVGFTGSTGGSKSTQTISNFSFESLATSTWNNAILAANGTSSNLQVGVGNAVINGLTLQTGSSLSLSKGIASSAPQVLTTSGLTIAGNTGHWTATLDVGSTDLDVQNGSLGTITNMVQQGYSNGTWQGSGGITSSAAAADSTHLTALGVIQNTVDGSTPLYGSGTALGLFDGTSPAATNVLIKETYYGDTDLNGVVDGTDYSRIDNGALNHLTGWFNGDFNYDGVIDGSDYTLIDNAYNQQGASLAAAVATAQVATSNEGSSVPEPASIALLGISAIGLLGRRRSR